MQERVDRIVHQLCEDLKERYDRELVRVILFGSHARGEATGESDIDVLVVLSGEQTDPFMEYTNWADWVVEKLLEEQELVNLIFTSRNRFETMHTPLYLNIHQDGIVTI